jgi:hypothetical protein
MDDAVFLILLLGSMLVVALSYRKMFQTKSIAVPLKVASYLGSFLIGIVIFALLNIISVPIFVKSLFLVFPAFHWQILKWLGGRKTSREHSSEEAERIRRREATLAAQEAMKLERETQRN